MAKWNSVRSMVFTSEITNLQHQSRDVIVVVLILFLLLVLLLLVITIIIVLLVSNSHQFACRSVTTETEKLNGQYLYNITKYTYKDAFPGFA